MSHGTGQTRLLLVEDDRLVRDTIGLMLEDEYHIVSAGTVAAALLHLGGDAPPIGVLLLDCLLPGGNLQGALTAADRLGIPVVLISGDVLQGQGLAKGRRFLAKPFSQSSLLAALAAAVRDGCVA